MSSPSYGPMTDFINSVKNAPAKLLSPLQNIAIPSWLPGGSHPDAHQQAIDQMNQQSQAQRVQAANQSHVDAMKPKGVLTQAARKVQR